MRKVTVRPVAADKQSKQSAGFFTPQSIADGFTNNVLGMVGLVVEGAKSGDDFKVLTCPTISYPSQSNYLRSAIGPNKARMERERLLAEKVEAKKRAKAAADAN